MRELLEEPLRPSQLAQRLPDAPHSTMMRRLSEMTSRNIVSHRREVGLPPRAHYALTTAGRRVLDVARAAERWERRWTSQRGEGTTALQLISNERAREIILLLAEGPAFASDLQTRLREPPARSTMQRHLAELVSRDIVIRDRTVKGSYELADSAPELALVAIAAARWEWEWASPTTSGL